MMLQLQGLPILSGQMGADKEAARSEKFCPIDLKGDQKEEKEENVGT